MHSPKDELLYLAKIYAETHGTYDEVGGWQARLGRIRVQVAAGAVFIDYLHPCAANFSPVFHETTGFMSADWYVILEKLRNELILERLSDV